MAVGCPSPSPSPTQSPTRLERVPVLSSSHGGGGWPLLYPSYLVSDSTPTPSRLRLDSDLAAATVMATAGRWLHVALASGRFIARLDPVADSTPIRLRLDSALVSDSTPTPTRLRLDSDSIPTPTRDSDPDPTQGPTRLRFRFELVSDSTPTPTSIRLRPDSAPDSTPTRLRLRLLRRDGGGGDPDEDDHDGVGRHPLRRLGFRRPRLANPFLLSLNPTLLLPSAPAVRVRFGSSQLRLSNSPWRASLALRPRAGVRHGLAAARRRRSGRPAAW